jgi:hypothetical protein
MGRKLRSSCVISRVQRDKCNTWLALPADSPDEQARRYGARQRSQRRRMIPALFTTHSISQLRHTAQLPGPP